MGDESEWAIVFYQEGSRSPVEEFISSLDKKAQVRLEWSIEQLRRRNVRAREPLVKHIEGKIWELREESRGNAYRVFYFMRIGRRIVLLHAFQKKTQRTPRGEIAVARRRMARIETALRG